MFGQLLVSSASHFRARHVPGVQHRHGGHACWQQCNSSHFANIGALWYHDVRVIWSSLAHNLRPFLPYLLSHIARQPLRRLRHPPFMWRSFPTLPRRSPSPLRGWLSRPSPLAQRLSRHKSTRALRARHHRKLPRPRWLRKLRPRVLRLLWP